MTACRSPVFLPVKLKKWECLSPIVLPVTSSSTPLNINLVVELSGFFFNFNQRYAAFNGGDSPLKRYDHTHTRSENSNSTTIVNRHCGYAGNGVSRAGVVVTLAKGKQNVSACIFDVETSCACALESRIYNDCGNWSGPSTS